MRVSLCNIMGQASQPTTGEERRSKENHGTDLREIPIGDQDVFGECGQRCSDLHRILDKEYSNGI